MSRRTRVLTGAVVAIAIALIAAPVAAQEAESESPFGIGFQSAWPSYGISGLYDLNEQVTLQAIVGALGTVTSFGARGSYRFQTEDKYDLYGFGTVGLWRYNYGLGTEGVLGFGGGAGVELDWRRILTPEDDSFPPLYSSFDLGYVIANFDHYGSWNGLSFGGAIHYRF